MELTPEQRERIYHEEALRRGRPETKVRRGNGFSAWLWGSLLLLAFVGCGRLFSAPTTPEEKAQAAASEAKYQAEAESDLAVRMAQKFVTDRLKAPATARFPDVSDRKLCQRYKASDGNYCVLSFVDSENSFGAKLRMMYACTLHPTGGDNWRLDNLTLGE